MAALWLWQDSRFAGMLHRFYLVDVFHDGSEEGRIVLFLGGFEVGRDVCAVRQVVGNMVSAELLFPRSNRIAILIHQFHFMMHF
ncbi:hypothetical protein [Aeromonas sp. ASNIH5]|uniref:hypothetical protein n=1 Tax=Aeromonas sp. ASNIH5 TaxID=1758179 RepID=UPI001315220C|nr:hypothetical protein [Aeromonas sp. ASNIH5]